MANEKPHPPRKTVAFWVCVGLASPFIAIMTAATLCGIDNIMNPGLPLAPAFFGIAVISGLVVAVFVYLSYRFGLIHDPPLPKPGIRVLLVAMLVVSLMTAACVVIARNLGAL